MIYHITHKDNWQKAHHSKTFIPDSFEREGFIHCSPLEKVTEVANNFYKGQKDLILLCIDESKVKSEIIWEDLYNHDFNFPHIYGELNTDAVINISDMNCDKEGCFLIPKIQ